MTSGFLFRFVITLLVATVCFLTLGCGDHGDPLDFDLEPEGAVLPFGR